MHGTLVQLPATNASIVETPVLHQQDSFSLICCLISFELGGGLGHRLGSSFKEFFHVGKIVFSLNWAVCTVEKSRHF